jgi:four helix bundle protein
MAAEEHAMLNFPAITRLSTRDRVFTLVVELASDVPKGHAERTDQLVRSAESVVRNIAEGAGRWSGRDSAKHYKIARGEAMECAASLDVMKLRRLVREERYATGIRLLESVVSMLTKMI